MAKKQVLTAEQAEEFTHNLGQITAGDYGLMDMAINTLQVPAALGMTPEEWVQERLGGYVRWTVEQRREAVRGLTEEGKSARQISEILGISETTVDGDRAFIKAGGLLVGEEKKALSPGKQHVGEEITPQRRDELTREMIEEGRSNAEIVVEFQRMGVKSSLGTVGKVKTAMAKEKLAAASATKAATAPSEAEKKAVRAKAGEIEQVVTRGVLEAFGFDPARTAEELADELSQVLDADVEFDIVRTISAWVKAGDDLWVIGAKRGLDVSQIVRSIDRIKEGE